MNKSDNDKWNNDNKNKNKNNLQRIFEYVKYGNVSVAVIEYLEFYRYDCKSLI